MATDLLVERFFGAFNAQETTTATNEVVRGEERVVVAKRAEQLKDRKPGLVADVASPSRRATMR